MNNVEWLTAAAETPVVYAKGTELGEGTVTSEIGLGLGDIVIEGSREEIVKLLEAALDLVRPSDKAVVVTVRHPDAENDHHTFGGYSDTHTFDIDLGSSFDVTKIGVRDWDEILEWAQGLYEAATELDKVNFDAGEFVRSVAEETLANCLPDGHDGCEVSTYIRGEQELVFDAETGNWETKNLS
jgi:hypothetical protein